MLTRHKWVTNERKNSKTLPLQWPGSAVGVLCWHVLGQLAALEANKYKVALEDHFYPKVKHFYPDVGRIDINVPHPLGHNGPLDCLMSMKMT